MDKVKKLKKALGLFITDIHLNKDNIELIKDLFSQLSMICAQLGIKRIFCAGDIFTNRSGQPLSCLTAFKEILEELNKCNISFLAIPGNHDKTDDDDERSYLDVYTDFNFQLFRSGEIKIFPETVVAFIPYFKDERWLKEYEEICGKIEDCYIDGDIDDSFSKILITHSGFDGVMNNDGSKVESLIKPSMFKGWDRVLIGHYHNASQLAENVIYTGSLYQNNYGETITDKGATIIFNDGSVRHIPLRFPKYIKEVVDVNDKDTLRNLLDKYEGEDYDHIRFVFRGSKADANKIDTAALAKLGIDAKFEAQETEDAVAAALSENDAIISCDKKSIMRDFAKFCSENKIRGKHLQYGLKLIKTI